MQARWLGLGLVGIGVFRCAPVRPAQRDPSPAPGPSSSPSGTSPPEADMALGRPYTLSPAPNYPHGQDDPSHPVLTDGSYVRGGSAMWLSRGVVGWLGVAPTITIDLGRSTSIDRVAIGTGWGVADVELPLGVVVLSSDDAVRWREVGDVMEGAPEDMLRSSGRYRAATLRSTPLSGHGRYVRLLVIPNGPFTMLDEVQVLGRPDVPADAANKPAASHGEWVTDWPAFAARARLEVPLRRRLRRDLASVGAELSRVGPAAATPGPIEKELQSIERATRGRLLGMADPFRTVFPMSALHARIFRAQAAVWRRLGFDGITLSPADLWGPLDPTSPPARGSAAIDLTVLRDEYRSGAFNVSNAGDEDAEVTLAFEGLPGSPKPGSIAVWQVPFTDTQSGFPVASALLSAGDLPGGYQVHVPAGSTRQVWLTFHPGHSMAAGEYAGRVSVMRAGVAIGSVPLRLRVLPLFLPRPRLHLSGWDYTDGTTADVTAENRQALVRELQAHFVDSPWATASTLPPGGFEPSGRMVRPPDPSRAAAWLREWPDARNYCVFLHVGPTFAAFEVGSTAFERAIAEWISWWVRWFDQSHVAARRLHLLLVDEPRSKADDELIASYAKAIHSAEPRVRIWEDAGWAHPAEDRPATFDLADVLSPAMDQWLESPAYRAFVTARRRPGQELWFYSAHVAPRTLDPYVYYRLQSWRCWKWGAVGTSFWSFADAGGASSWNEYAAKAGGYAPEFLDARTVVSSKSMEALREGVEDYEELAMLRDAALGKKTAAAQAARDLLQGAVDRVTAGLGPDALRWDAPKDRSSADRVRAEVLAALVTLR